YYAGIAFAEPLVEGIKRCGKDLTREKLVSEMEKIKDFQGISGKITYKPFNANDPSCRQGQNQTYLVKCLEGGAAERLTDWMTIQ
ncbi:MAG: ABC transporter substrate-binding protein, partial [Thermodesulfobacteriota bacterium]